MGLIATDKWLMSFNLMVNNMVRGNLVRKVRDGAIH
jgi:hypothetical protein